MRAIVVMGVAGCGKTTIAQGLAEALGWRSLEGDAFQPPANIAKMTGGTPLTDDDRWPWLAAIAAEADRLAAQGVSTVIACSALRRVYRDVLIGERPDVALVYLRGGRALIAERLADRRGHFMPPTLLDSQFATLEEPGADENPITVSVADPPATMIAAILAAFALRTC